MSHRQTTQVQGHPPPSRKRPVLEENVAVFFPVGALPRVTTLSHQEGPPREVRDLKNLQAGQAQTQATASRWYLPEQGTQEQRPPQAPARPRLGSAAREDACLGRTGGQANMTTTKKRGVHVSWEILSGVQRCPVQNGTQSEAERTPTVRVLSLYYADARLRAG